MATKIITSPSSVLLVNVCLLLIVPFIVSLDLTRESFKEYVGTQKNVFIEFYAPWCPHCIELVPIWDKLMRSLDTANTKVIVAKVDCTKESELCNTESIQNYPTLRLYLAGDKTGGDYEGPRDLFSLSEFLEKQLNLGVDDFVDIDDDVEEEPSQEKKEALEAKDENKQDLHWPQQDDIAPPDPVQGLYELTDENSEKFLANGRHFVKFYAPWCSHCQRLAPVWEKLAESFQYDKSVHISKLDCESFRLNCQAYEIKGYPTLLWIVDGKVVEKYQGARTHEDLKAFIELKKSDELKDAESVRVEDVLIQLTDSNFSHSIKHGVTFVKFFAPWCTFCKRLSETWNDLALKLSPKGIRVAKVDCSQFEGLCNKYGVDGYPTLLMFKNGEKVIEYEDERDLENLVTFAMNYVEKPRDEL